MLWTDTKSVVLWPASRAPLGKRRQRGSAKHNSTRATHRGGPGVRCIASLGHLLSEKLRKLRFLVIDVCNSHRKELRLQAVGIPTGWTALVAKLIQQQGEFWHYQPPEIDRGFRYRTGRWRCSPQRICHPLLHVITWIFYQQRSAAPLGAQARMPVFLLSLKAVALRD